MQPLEECLSRARLGRQTVARRECRRERGGDPFLASSDTKLLPVLRVGPLQRHSELQERALERRQMEVPFGFCEHAVAIEDECGHAVVAALSGSLTRS